MGLSVDEFSLILTIIVHSVHKIPVFPCTKKGKKKKRTPKCCIQLCKDTIVLENENANAKLLFVHVHFINILALNLVLMMYINPAVSLTWTDGQFIWFKFFFLTDCSQKSHRR